MLRQNISPKFHISCNFGALFFWKKDFPVYSDQSPWSAPNRFLHALLPRKKNDSMFTWEVPRYVTRTKTPKLWERTVDKLLKFNLLIGASICGIPQVYTLYVANIRWSRRS